MIAANAILTLILTLPIGPVVHGDRAADAAVIRATGVGRPPARMQGARAGLMARRAAEVVAVRNLSAKVHRQGWQLRGFRYISTKQLPNGWVEVSVEARIPRR